MQTSPHKNARRSSRNISLDDSLEHHPMLIPARKSSKYQAPEQTIFDVIIIGAGITGLLAAQILLKQQKTVLVLQMSESCGGSIKQQTINQLIKPEQQMPWIANNKLVRNTKLEIGTSELMSDHTYMMKMCEQYDLTLTPMYSDGKFIYGKNQDQFSTVFSMMDVYFCEEHKKAISKLLAKIQNISKNILEVHDKIINNPGKNHYLKVLKQYIQKFDLMTVRQFFTSELENQNLRNMVINQFEIVQSIEVDKVSMFHVFLHGYGLQNLKYFTQMKSYLTQNVRIKQGNMELIDRMKSKLLKRQKKNGQQEVLKFKQKVLQIKNQINKQVQVLTNKRSYKCFKVFFSATMQSACQVKISKLSDTKRLLLDNQEQGNLQRVFLMFQSAFWRSKFSGKALFSQNFPVSEMVDVSPSNLSCGVLCLVICGSKTTKWKQHFGKIQDPIQLKKAQKQYLLNLICKMFLNGNRQSQYLKSMQIYVADSDNYCYQSFTKVGIAYKLESQKQDYLECYIRDQHNIIFLGSELSKKFGSYMQGAVRHTREQIHRYLQMEDPWTKM